MAQGFTLWLTGLPASGKTEIATRVEESLLERGLDAERIDEGEVREAYFQDLGYDRPAWEGLVRFLDGKGPSFPGCVRDPRGVAGRGHPYPA